MKKVLSIILSMSLCFLLPIQVSAAEVMPKENVIEKEEVSATTGSSNYISRTIRLNSISGSESAHASISTGSVIGNISSIVFNVRASGDPFKLYLQAPDGTLFWITMDSTGDIGVDNSNGKDLSGSWTIWIETLGTASSATISAKIYYDFG